MSRLTWALTVALAAFFITPAQAQRVCGNRADIVKRLTETHKERPHAQGIVADGKLFEIFASESGSWSVLITRPNGPTCLVVVGQDWHIESGPTNPTTKGI